MKKELSKDAATLRQGLQSLLDKGFYEESVQVLDFKAVMHILTDGEEVEVSVALRDCDLITREKQRVIEFLSHAVSEVNGISFEDLPEARKFFSLCTAPFREAFIKSYHTIVPKGEAQLKQLGVELKNSQGPEKASVSGS